MRECDVDCFDGFQEAGVLFQFDAAQHQKSSVRGRRDGGLPFVSITLNQKMSAPFDNAGPGRGLLRATTIWIESVVGF